MKKETKELLQVIGVAFLLIMAVPLAYRAVVHFRPPEEKPRQTLARYLEEAQMARCIKLLTTPAGKWSEVEVILEPEIHAWLKEQGSEILPWEWTEEARRKDPKGYAKCWRRVWKDWDSCCESLLAEQQKESKRLDREIQMLAAIHAHRTNQVARLRDLASTNAFPCQISLERLKKGRLWGWNKEIEVIECKDAMDVLGGANSICSVEIAAAEDEDRKAKALSDSLALSKAKSAMYEKLCQICDMSNSLVDDEISADHDVALRKSLVEVLKGAKK